MDPDAGPVPQPMPPRPLTESNDNVFSPLAIFAKIAYTDLTIQSKLSKCRSAQERVIGNRVQIPNSPAAVSSMLGVSYLCHCSSERTGRRCTGNESEDLQNMHFSIAFEDIAVENIRCGEFTVTSCILPVWKSLKRGKRMSWPDCRTDYFNKNWKSGNFTGFYFFGSYGKWGYHFQCRLSRLIRLRSMNCSR